MTVVETSFGTRSKEHGEDARRECYFTSSSQVGTGGSDPARKTRVAADPRRTLRSRSFCVRRAIADDLYSNKHAFCSYDKRYRIKRKQKFVNYAYGSLPLTLNHTRHVYRMDVFGNYNVDEAMQYKKFIK